MLIDKVEIAKHRELSRSVRDDKINPYIQDAEYLDLRPLLGDRLYYDLVKNSTEAKYISLLSGGEYTYQGSTYNHQGLNKVLSLFSYARYVLFGTFTDTAFGFVQKSNQDSQPVPEAQKRNIHTKDKHAAIEYFREVATYLNRNREIYPEWQKDCRKPLNSGFRISKITT